eukprot:scaffold1000_cov166-Amphora_coffeaeformis.AAC.26
MFTFMFYTAQWRIFPPRRSLGKDDDDKHLHPGFKNKCQSRIPNPSPTPHIPPKRRGKKRKGLDSTMTNPFAIVMISSFLSSLKSYRGVFCATTCRRFSSPSSDNFFRGDLTVLDQGEHWLVVEKTPSVVCHHSECVGSRQRQEVPMLQRTRDAFSGRRVNLVQYVQ